MQEQVNHVVDQHSPNLGVKSRNEIMDICQEVHVTASSLIVKKGNRNNSDYFLLGGVVRSYLMNPEGKLVTLFFFEKASVITPHVTRASNLRSLINLEALTECNLVEIDASKFESLIEQNLEI